MNAAVDHSQIYHNGRTFPEHCAWLDSLTGDDYPMVYMPPGCLINLAYVSYFKLALLTVEMPAAVRLRLLEAIAGMVSGSVTAEAVAAIEPACNTAVEMFHELHKVGTTQVSRAFHDGNMFSLLAKLNPSLLRALELCHRHQPAPQASP